MKQLALVIALGFISYNSVASSVVYDTDGSASRVTYYNNSPIDAMVTQSSSAYDLTIYTPHFTNPTPCQSAAVYDQNTDALISVLSANYKTLSGQIPEGFEHKAKYVQANCTDEQGNSQTLRHNIAPAPKVTLTSQLSVDNWLVSDGFSPGHFDSVVYQALINIDNGEKDGNCVSNSLVGQTPTLLNERHRFGFYSDVINVNGDAKYNARAGVLVNEVICKSTGGTTRLVEVWNVSEQQQNREVTVEVF
ncbi:hypothetical protein PSECIP111951_00929 [Pseudoalteromonas holothuriae]|uniref:Uncharacterized protein n=1 Tax=Pseudoalteromonas holothuriae TaxID=2963714 RepID=A0ABM9GG29_9GAMM|nr:hypothetical protein [Pseudoalteromonas sp. CIP111951]CAH9053961.1 hypothetical protein PSECIP111951_00929 [Pseudoalteromonas sp. CIP111951]